MIMSKYILKQYDLVKYAIPIERVESQINNFCLEWGYRVHTFSLSEISGTRTLVTALFEKINQDVTQ